ncbi:C40 family peptidase [Streptomyces sp. NBC_00237]|uniref:peptidase M23 n=1 Tax=Streptomyces sp. NBC_00237 TaxID=2975687 RepID=UPI00225B04AC|nr:peptidase M23 [Streptomyces sp. NBC_00237]MCX5207689.1 C40 family peptidase [Streptomyces sp. NBC_00237]
MTEGRDAARVAVRAALLPAKAKIAAAVAVPSVLLFLAAVALPLAGGAVHELQDKARGAECAPPGLPELDADADAPPEFALTAQTDNAKIIDSVAKGRGLSGQATLIGLMTGLQESGLRNVPHGHADSVGLFQQRPSQGWGTRAELLNPRRSSRLFYGSNPGRPPGLTDIPGWETMPPGDAAQAVQHSAHPELYAGQRLTATQIAHQAGIDLGRAGTGAARPDDDQGSAAPFTDECGRDSGAPGAPFHDAAAGWPDDVRNPRSTADAIAWARQEAASGRGVWYRRCLAFVAIVHGWHVSGVPYAIDHYRKMPAAMRHDKSRDVPPGALMYWDTGSRAGHVAVYLGDGQLASNDIVRPGYIDVVPAASIEKRWGARYLGWAPPHFPEGS